MQLEGPAAPAVHRRGPRMEVEDLSVYELHGGHTLKRHVGLSQDQALRRIRDGETAAGSFSDRMTAQRAVDDAIQAHGGEIAAWLWSPASRSRLAFVAYLGRVVGTSLTRRDVARGVETPSHAMSVRLVLQANDQLAAGFTVVTAYPTRERVSRHRAVHDARRESEGVPA